MPRGARKRRREHSPDAAAAAAAGERKLLPGEDVEVFSFAPGLCGSWHQGAVTGIWDNLRSVRYSNFVNNSGLPLVERVKVSDAIDGKSSVPGGSTRGRIRPVLGRIRPVHPHEPLQLSDASYGLCVDALLDGSYWEGVIVDHAQGSTERKVFFPDEGNERVLAVDQLRRTQDWDEVTGKWKPRGTWLFLQMLSSHEEKDGGLPVSVRQIWYDLSSDPSFNMWMCGTKSFAERSLAELLAELWSVSGRPLQDGHHSCRSAQASTSAGFQNKEVEPTVLDMLDSTPADISQTISQFISCYRRIDMVGARVMREPVKRHLKSLGWTFVEDKPKDKHFVAPDGKRFRSVIGAAKAYLAEREKKSNRQDCHTNDDLVLYSATRNDEYNNPTGMDLALRKNKSYNKLSMDASTSWKPEQLNAELSPMIASLLSSYQEVTTLSQRHIRETMRMKLKKHLLGLGWSIVFREDKVIRRQDKPYVSKRYRYKSPVGEIYSSILEVLKSFAVQCVRQVQGNRIEDNHNYFAAHRLNLDATASRDLARLGKRKRRQKSVPMSQARVLSSRHGQILPSQHRAKNLLSLLVEKNIILPRAKLIYKQKSNGPQIKEGSIVRDVIKCNCCNLLFTLERFEVHAGCSTQLPAAHMFLKDGRSLSQCLVELMAENKPKISLHVRLKKDYSDIENDSICSICNDGGDILLCDGCPSSFHHACVGLEATPEGRWYCPSCRCSICDSGDYDNDTNQYTEKTIMYCDQCEREYHVGCIRNQGDHLTCCPEGCWFCSRECSEIFQHLQELIGKPIPTPVEGLSCTILKFDRENTSDDVDFDDEKMAEQYGKLRIALDVLHECFVTIIEPRTRRDISEDIVFNRESELRRLNFRGFYTILLQKDGALISVGTVRICGKKFAELPLIGTRVQYRRQGMCRLMMNELEKLLSGLGVERLLLPAVPQLVETWTGSFGFTAMSNSDRFELVESSVLSFQGTTMCQKILNAVCNPKEMSIQLVLNAEQMEFERTTTRDTTVNNVSNHSEELKVTALTNYTSLELTENSIFQGSTIYQKVSSNVFSLPEESNGSEYELECASKVHEISESDGQESNSLVMEYTDRLEIRSNSGEEDICAIHVPTSSPDQEVSFTVDDSHGQPYGRSAQRELCFD